MTTEFWLFLIVGAVAVVSAMMMLLSENAVHSALFLVLVMACIAFLFLMLNAPFLAMVQITVYAGAIMVLFLFVIMLLGTEKLVGGSPARWMTPTVLVLALIFLVTIALALGSGPISDFAPPPAAPQVRIAYFAPDAGPVDLRVDGTVVKDSIQYSDTVGYYTFAAGDHDIALDAAGTENAVVSQTVSLEAGFVGTVVVYGAGAQPTLSVVSDNLAATPEREGRLTVFDAYSDVPAISLVDFGNAFDSEDTQTILDSVSVGEESSALALNEDTNMAAWAVVEAGKESNVLARLDNPDLFNVKRGTSTLLVVALDRRFDGTVRALVVPLAAAALPTFGSPANVGQQLFSRYMLPMQAVAILLLVAMVGAIVLTHRPKPSAALVRARMGRRRVSRPLTRVIAAQVGHDVSQMPGSGTGELPERTDEPAGD